MKKLFIFLMQNLIACTVCKKDMNTPVCVLCLTDRTEAWLEQKKISLTRNFRPYIQLFLAKIIRFGKMRCSMCRIETEYRICPSCFTKAVFNWLNENDTRLAAAYLKEFSYYLEPKKLIA